MKENVANTLGLALFQAARDSKKVSENISTTLVSYPSGFLPIDYVNGQRIKAFNDNGDIVQEYDSVGFVGGTFVTVIADPGLGKTTFVQQTAANIASMFDRSFIIHEDIERSSNINRVYNITGQSAKWIKSHYRMYQGASGEDFVDRILDHAKVKINNRKMFEYDTGLKDLYGDPIKALIPTIVILDSLSVMRSENSSIREDQKNLEGLEDVTGNMQGARNSKFNSEVIRQLNPWIGKANILVFIICQINRKINAGFVPQARDVVGLGENESLSGGRTAIYMTNNILRFKNKGMLHTDKDYGINGNIISAEFYKSRTAATNVPVELIFDKNNGFSKCLTLLHFAINENIVKKSGNKLVVPGCEDTPFYKKNFIEEAVQNPKLIVQLYDLCLPKFQAMMGKSLEDDDTSSEDEDNEGSMFDLFGMLDED